MDLFGDLPPAAGDDATTTTTAAKAASSGPSLLKPRATATAHLMPPPKRPTVRPPAHMAPLHARPRVSAVAQAPIEIHAQNKQFAASKFVSSADESASSSELDDMEFGEGEGEGEAYDPAKPNDYMEYCQERVEKKKQEERDRELQKYMKERDEEQKRQQREIQAQIQAGAPPEAAIQAAVGRGRGRGGVSNLPAWMVKGNAQGEGLGAGAGAGAGATATSSEPGRYEDAEQQQQQPPVQGGQAAQGKGKKEPGIGALLMQKMGYKEGAGLGRDEQGITKAIRHKATGGGQGTIEGPSMTKTAAAPGVPGAPASSDRKGKKRGGLFSNPTKIVLLKNMVGPGEVDDELQAETAEECAKHGPVKQCLIFEIKDESFPVEERVRIFVAFERQESAVKAYVAMNGRFFGGRRVQASFFDEDRFARHDLGPQEGEGRG